MKYSRIKFLLLEIAFTVLFLASLYLYQNRQHPYIRPTSYFVLLAFMAAVVFLQSLNCSSGNVRRALIILNILLIAYSFILTQQALYKTVLSRDPWGHMVLTYQILKGGHIPSPESAWTAGVYTKMPGFHLILSVLINILDVSYKWASVVLGLGILTGVVIWGYLFSRTVLDNKKLALIASLLIAVSDNVLSMTGINIVPNSLGVLMVLTAFYILFRVFTENEVQHSLVALLIVVILIMVSLSVMHSVSYGFMLIHLLIFMMLGVLLFRKIPSWVSILSLLGGIVAFFEWGMRSNYYLPQLILLLKFLFLGIGVEYYEKNVSNIPFSLIILARMGMLIYFALAAFSILLEIRRFFESKEWSRKRIVYLIQGGFFTGIALPITFFWAGIGHRFWYYGEILGAPFVSKLIGGIKRSVGLLLVIFLSFLMFTSSVANDDNPLVPQYTLRTGWYDSELASARFILLDVDSPIAASDWGYIHHIEKHISKIYGHSVVKSKRLESIRRISLQPECLLVVRKDIIESRLFELKNPRDLNLPLENEAVNILRGLSTTQNVIYTDRNVLIFLGTQKYEEQTSIRTAGEIHG
ncbi:hypothetical protein [Thermococcus sp. MAR1]|uniref:hypothetical protein n=1 Tax=Thermococcus sp. MAR1 TaxID=1638263 RepID=UPI0014395A48|nr:hypothetical protein [Thermococcus sp. MAR1]NJE11148.1 hypothetical protein [Thermococcus sp. MAR1]